MALIREFNLKMVLPMISRPPWHLQEASSLNSVWGRLSVLASLALGLCTLAGGAEAVCSIQQERLETLPSCRGFSPQLSLIKFSKHFLTPTRCGGLVPGAHCRHPARRQIECREAYWWARVASMGLLCFRAQ